MIRNMQQHTVDAGYNLKVAAMSTKDFSCPQPFFIDV
ncbi:hypothetical protein [Lonsdalea britannica]|nr:hypothetical protein [Lonsdalea britannica]